MAQNTVNVQCALHCQHRQLPRQARAKRIACIPCIVCVWGQYVPGHPPLRRRASTEIRSLIYPSIHHSLGYPRTSIYIHPSVHTFVLRFIRPSSCEHGVHDLVLAHFSAQQGLARATMFVFCNASCLDTG